jgi:Holliday junction resolvasome RuvABC endonuclease subunit
MKTLAIEKVEKLLNKKVRKNAISIGFDVAEHFTGVCLLRTDDRTIHINDLFKIETSHKEDLIHRMDNFINSLDKFLQDIDSSKNFRIVVIEDCWFGRNVETLKHLARFSALIYVAFRKYCDYITFLLPNSARSIVGFNQHKQQKVTNIQTEYFIRGKNKGKAKKINLKDLIKEYLEMAFQLKIKDSDEADGFVLALAGLLK